MRASGTRPNALPPRLIRRLIAAATTAVLAVALAACNAPSNADPAPSGPGDPSDPLYGTVIAIDPGHNGGNADHPEIVDKEVDVLTGKKPCNTTGTETDDGYAEHAFNWDVATRLAELLRARGATVVLTRDSDDGVGPCNPERAKIGNDAGADAAVSIHADGACDDCHGFHIMEPVLIEGHTEPILEPSHRLALAIRDAYQDGTGLPPANYIGEHGLNPRDDMGGLNFSTVPKVMVECGNMRHEGDAEKLKDPGFRQKIADSLATGLTTFLTPEA